MFLRRCTWLCMVMVLGLVGCSMPFARLAQAPVPPQTPYPTYTAYPTYTPQPGATPSPEQTGRAEATPTGTTPSARATEASPLPPSPVAPSPAATHASGAGGTDNAAFVADETIPDNTQMAPGSAFTKTWSIKNTGNTHWGEGYELRFAAGEQMGAPAEVPLPAADPGETVRVSVAMVAPEVPGSYRGEWEACVADHCFGPHLSVQIIVQAAGSAAPTPVPSGNTVSLQGSGPQTVGPVRVPGPVCTAHYTHSGSGTFRVLVSEAGEQDLVVDTVGAYEGTRPLAGYEAVTFEIQADGTWSIRIQPVAMGGAPAFSGKGDAVSAAFDPPGNGPWLITHDGKGKFVVNLHCIGGSQPIQNKAGAVNAERNIEFLAGPCLWEVVADGNFSLRPR